MHKTSEIVKLKSAKILNAAPNYIYILTEKEKRDDWKYRAAVR